MYSWKKNTVLIFHSPPQSEINDTLLLILWHVYPLLGNDREITSYTTAAARLWFCKQQPVLGNGRQQIRNIQTME
jgi:hypothetical protein